MKKFLLLIVLTSNAAFSQFTDYNIIKEVKTKNKGTVVCAHPLASEAGAKILKMGGNAFDAVVATQYALAVVYPQAGNIGGGGFLVGAKNNGEKFTLDYRETAPESASRDMYLDKNGNANTDLSQNGRLAVGVPGSVAGFFATQKYCRLPMAQLIQPAIDLAEKGFAVTEREANLLNSQQEFFNKHNQNSTIFQKKTWKAGDLLIQKDLAETLKKIQKLGAKGFYEGKTAELIVAEMKRGNGVITLNDLKNYKVIERKPLIFNYKGNEIVSMPLPSSGGLLLAEMLKMCSYENLEKYQQNSTQAVQIMVEAERRAYADRAEYMGDPDFINDKTDMLISDDYLKNRWKNYNPNQATKSSEVGKIINPNQKESTETTHISIIDKEGNMASCTTTLNGLYGSKVVVTGAGFFLNNEMDDFSVKPGVPNMFGAVGGEANSIKPGKRMLSSMTPTIVLKNGKPLIVVGTPGGTTIPTSVFQSIVDVLDFKSNANISVNAPKFHHQWLPEIVVVEKNFPESTVSELEKMGYKIEKANQIGRTEMILIDENGNIHAVADGRGDDSVGVE